MEVIFIKNFSRKMKFYEFLSFIVSLVVVLSLALPVKNLGLRAFKSEIIEIYQDKAPTKQSDNFKIQSIKLGDDLVDVKRLRIKGWKTSDTITGYPLYTDGYNRQNKIELDVDNTFILNNPKITWAIGENYWRAYVSYQDSKIMELNGYNDTESTSEVTIKYPSLISIIGQYFIIASAVIFLTLFFIHSLKQSVVDEKIVKKKLTFFYLRQLPKIFLFAGLFMAFKFFYDNRIKDTPLYLFGMSMKMTDMVRFLTLSFLATLGFRYAIKDETRISQVIARLVFYVNPLISFLFLEFAYNPSISEMSIWYILLNSFIVLSVQMLIYLLTRSRKVSMIAVMIICVVFGILNDILMIMRDSPLIPAFLGMLGVATDVAGEQVIEFSGKNIAVLLYASMWIFLILATPRIKEKLTFKKYFISLVSYSIAMFAVVFASNYYYINHAKVGVNLWRPSRTYYVEGSPFSFYRLAVDQVLKKPDNYSRDRAEKVLEKYYNEPEDSKADVKTDIKPNIIMIQSEALADYYSIGQLKLTENPLEFQRSLKENTIQGNLHVSVLGGGTVNTEYEALTGNSLSFFPGGSYPFQQYVDNRATSIGRLLENQGYETYITHPNKKTNYSREEVWTNLGFKNMEFLKAYNGDEEEDNEKYKKMNSDMYVHGHVSDKAMFERLMDKYKNKSDKPLFSYLVTMQNHGAYPGSYQGEIDVIGHEGEDKGANEFINLCKKSDDDFKELVEFFKNYDEPTIICIYGDHQPQNYKYFLDVAYGAGNYGNYESHYTPLTIWANYDIEDEHWKEISANYLSAYLFDKAGLGLKKSAYQKYQLDMLKEYPIMTRFNNRDNHGREVTDDPKFKEHRNELDTLIYYNVKDPKREDKYFNEPALK